MSRETKTGVIAFGSVFGCVAVVSMVIGLASSSSQGKLEPRKGSWFTSGPVKELARHPWWKGVTQGQVEEMLDEMSRHGPSVWIIGDNGKWALEPNSYCSEKYILTKPFMNLPNESDADFYKRKHPQIAFGKYILIALYADHNARYTVEELAAEMLVKIEKQYYRSSK